MSVQIKFRPDERDGIVAEGSYLLDAARRLGVNVPAECGRRGECDTCAVVVEEGATLLSSLTDAERVRLSPERLATGERLACQTKVEHAGELVLRLVPATEREETTEETVKEFRREFRELPLKKKIVTLAELEAVTMFQTLGEIANLPFTIGEKIMAVMAVRGRALSEKERREKRPADKTESATQGEAGEGSNA